MPGVSQKMSTARNADAGPRPPLADRLTPAQWLALDAAAAVIVALWVVFDLRLRHGFRFELPQAWFGALGAAVTLPVAGRRLWPIPVLGVVTTAVATMTALGRAELDMDIMLGMAVYTEAGTSPRPAAAPGAGPGPPPPPRGWLRRAARRRQRG